MKIKINYEIQAMEKFYIGFDFSINKPAMTILHNGEINFHIWPREMSEKLMCIYKDNGVFVDCRNLSPIKKKEMDESTLTMEHTVRSLNLANQIIKCIKDYIGNSNAELYICSEGLSFGSVGDASLNLATYKGVLLSKLLETFGDKIKLLATYAPLSIKATAGCTSKEKRGLKNAMIEEFKNSDCKHIFKQAIIDGKFDSGKNYKECVDDIVDSFWAIKTMFKKQEWE